MAKLKMKTSNTNTAPMNNGGIMGSGIFGMFGSTVHCNADNNSLYCSITKIVNLIIMLLFIFIIFYLLYLAGSYFIKGNKFTNRKK